MTVKAFKEMMMCNEPDFEYNGETYSICNPDGKYYVLASDSPGDADLVFDSLEVLLDGWIIQGKPLRDIVQHLQFWSPSPGD